jgi:hypothetical protein
LKNSTDRGEEEGFNCEGNIEVDINVGIGQDAEDNRCAEGTTVAAIDRIIVELEPKKTGEEEDVVAKVVK